MKSGATLEDALAVIEPAGPAFVALNHHGVLAWYKARKDGRVAIIPLIEGTPPVATGADDIQAACELET
jgi:hypothetical protein